MHRQLRMSGRRLAASVGVVGGLLTFALVLPSVAAAASYPATQYAVTLTGNAEFKAVSAGNSDNWTVTAAFPLNGTGTVKNNGSIWIPTGASTSSETVYPITSPDFNIINSDPNSTLTLVGSGGCSDTIINSLFPELSVTTGSSSTSSFLLDWNGDATPFNPSGNGNSFPDTCSNPLDATFDIVTPFLETGPTAGEGGFDLPWNSDFDSIRFTLPNMNGTSASQSIQATSISQVATTNNYGYDGLDCSNGGGVTCTQSYPIMSEQVQLTKVCAGTVTPQVAPPNYATGQPGGTGHKYLMLGSCNPTSPPSHTKITQHKISGTTAKFSFSAKTATGYQCSLVKKGKGAKFAKCTSPHTYKSLKPGRYTFEVRGVNLKGADKHPASDTFKIS